MFVVKIDLWPHGDVTNGFNHTTIAACNDGTGTPEAGNYEAAIVPENVAADGDYAIHLWFSKRHRRDGAGMARVRNFPRGHDQHHLPALTAEIITALGCREFLAAA